MLFSTNCDCPALFQSLLMIANKCQRLQHLSIRSSTMGIVALEYPAGHMMELCRLRELKSLSLAGVEEGANWVDKFLISLAIVGMLEVGHYA